MLHLDIDLGWVVRPPVPDLLPREGAALVASRATGPQVHHLHNHKADKHEYEYVYSNKDIVKEDIRL